MITLKVKRGGKFVPSIREYNTIEEAEKRIEELKKVGITAKIVIKKIK